MIRKLLAAIFLLVSSAVFATTTEINGDVNVAAMEANAAKITHMSAGTVPISEPETYSMVLMSLTLMGTIVFRRHQNR